MIQENDDYIKPRQSACKRKQVVFKEWIKRLDSSEKEMPPFIVQLS